MEPLERLEKMVDLTDRLSELVETENLALAERRYEVVEAMLEEKAMLARLYENNMRDLDEAKLDWSTVEGELHDRVTEAGTRLANAMGENTMRLEVGMEANKQVIDLFAQAVRESVPHSGTYSKNGRTGREGTKASANSLAVALDENL
jgi:flagellar biosynthesis/type III secretory pathway chaperone